MKKIFVLFIAIITMQGCGPYSFTGVNTTAETFQVNFFRNEAPIVEPGLDYDFTNALQDLIVNQTNLQLVNRNADLIYEGEITDYRVSPMSATADQTAAQNRLTIGVNVRFFNADNPEEDFERKFSFFYDYPAATQLVTVKQTAHEEIFERITQDIFNETLANW
ncbi:MULTISPECIES: LptE family protein [Galbibacter]|uniref:LptE family protein n=1 Tax=Galbibacter pacificus TaxID=2996052 RepID=A0ABT6FWM5_9FLAO|nr:LptE family protein [Galbibacter pacificus]MDG3584086.1 LptE family protein [Galbibacter pacificus]MDG3587481.1 LptE family protein [Galbibacter pacificus]